MFASGSLLSFSFWSIRVIDSITYCICAVFVGSYASMKLQDATLRPTMLFFYPHITLEKGSLHRLVGESLNKTETNGGVYTDGCIQQDRGAFTVCTFTVVLTET